MVRGEFIDALLRYILVEYSKSFVNYYIAVSYTHLTLPTIYSV